MQANRFSMLCRAVEQTWKVMLSEGVEYSTAEMQCGEEGPGALRSRLPEEFRGEPMSLVRKAWLANNRAAKMSSGKRANNGDPRQRIIKAAIHYRRILPHSAEYTGWITSEAWRQRAAQHKRECEYRCQICGKIKVGQLLEVHHIHYETLGNERLQDLLCVCADGCHALVDFMRQSTGDSEQFQSADALFGLIPACP